MKARSNLFLNAASGIGHFPFLSITIPSAAYFSGFKNRKIISPLLRDTSCSADGPPISTPTRILPIGTFIRFYFLRGGLDSNPRSVRWTSDRFSVAKAHRDKFE